MDSKWSEKTRVKNMFADIDGRESCQMTAQAAFQTAAQLVEQKWLRYTVQAYKPDQIFNLRCVARFDLRVYLQPVAKFP